MTINKTSGDKITFADIVAEFGTPKKIVDGEEVKTGIGSFRLEGGKVIGDLTLPLDTGIPTSGPIKFSDFYGKQLNQVVDYFDSTNNGPDDDIPIPTNAQNAKSRWDAGFCTVIGSDVTNKSKSGSSKDTKVIIYVNYDLGGFEQDNDQRMCALTTGNWDENTSLSVVVGSSANIVGAGGTGGTGGESNGNGQDGGNGGSALGIEYPCTLNNLGYIQSGYGGGGGGGGRTFTTGGGKFKPSNSNGSSGGGGGGGSGSPVGFAGLAPDSKFGPNGTNGSDGGPGTLSTKAIGGVGGQGANAGGDSSEVDNTSTKASNGSTDSSGTGSGGVGGSNGYAIITNQSSLPTINNNLPIPSGPNNEGIVVGRKITSTQPNTV